MSENPGSFTEYIADHKTHLLITVIVIALMALLVLKTGVLSGNSVEPEALYEKL